MNGTAHAGLGYIALAVVLAAFLIRWAVTGGTPRPRRPKRVAIEVPAFHLIPAQQYACRACGQDITAPTTGSAL